MLGRPWAKGIATCELRKAHVDATKDLSEAAIERQLSRRDLPLREKTLWRMLYETAARANEILALDIEQLDLDNRRAPIRSKGGEIECIYWGTGTAHLLPRLLRLPDGSSRATGPLFPCGDRGVACLLGRGDALAAVGELAFELRAQLAVGVQRGLRTLARDLGGLGASCWAASEERRPGSCLPQ